MDASVKHRVIGSALVITIALVILPLFIKEKKPAWMVKEDRQSFIVPTAPAPIKVALQSPKKEWKMPTEAIKIITDNKVSTKVKVAELAFSEQQYALGSKTKRAIIEEQVAGFAQIDTKKSKGHDGVLFQSIKKESEKAYYSLQLATFSNVLWANRLLIRLKKQGVDGFLSQSQSKNGTLFTMVMVGRTPHKDEIKRLQQSLDILINVNSLIIKHT